MDRDLFLKWGSLTAFCIQNSANPIINRIAVTEASRNEAASTATILLCMEVVKMTLSIWLLWYEEGFNALETSAEIYKAFFTEFRDSLPLCIPALVFCVQNALLQWSFANLPAAIFQVTYQGKTLVTALFSVLLLKKQIKRSQWLAIFVMGLGLAAVQLSGAKEIRQSSMGNAAEQNRFVGLLMIGLACICSGFASVFTERILKQKGTSDVKKKSVWLQNVQLAFFSSIVASIGFMLNLAASTSATEVSTPPSLFRGFTWKTWMLVFNNAIGGLLVAIVLKHADNILRNFASAFATINCALASVFMFGFSLSVLFGVGSLVVIVSTLMYGGIVTLPGDWWEAECALCAVNEAPPAAAQPTPISNTTIAAEEELTDAEEWNAMVPAAKTVGLSVSEDLER
eukprot:TRINITY_DN92949_c0_g1_i1.p1 TRINITY_DN92949_c0_g1~~TRINITY_DN92949_c0_g1_i1.p1  ORF type:complete len:399 (+),score=73.26 TRINITY_DN92949_c0_g1_i1:67-1263(+)